MTFVPFTEADQPTMAAFNEKFQQCIAEAVSQAADQLAHVELVTWTGTGGFPKSVTLKREPKLIFVTRVTPDDLNGLYFYYMIAARGNTTAMGIHSVGNEMTGARAVAITWSGNTVTFTNGSLETVNGSGQYIMVAIT